MIPIGLVHCPSFMESLLPTELQTASSWTVYRQLLNMILIASMFQFHEVAVVDWNSTVSVTWYLHQRFNTTPLSAADDFQTFSSYCGGNWEGSPFNSASCPTVPTMHLWGSPLARKRSMNREKVKLRRRKGKQRLNIFFPLKKKLNIFWIIVKGY